MRVEQTYTTLRLGALILTGGGRLRCSFLREEVGVKDSVHFAISWSPPLRFMVYKYWVLKNK